MMAAMMTGESDIAQIMLKAGLGISALIIIILSTVTTTFLDAFSAGISFQSIISNLMDLLLVCWSLLLEHFVLLSFQWMILPISSISLVQSFLQ